MYIYILERKTHLYTLHVYSKETQFKSRCPPQAAPPASGPPPGPPPRAPGADRLPGLRALREQAEATAARRAVLAQGETAEQVRRAAGVCQTEFQTPLYANTK